MIEYSKQFGSQYMAFCTSDMTKHVQSKYVLGYAHAGLAMTMGGLAEKKSKIKKTIVD